MSQTTSCHSLYDPVRSFPLCSCQRKIRRHVPTSTYSWDPWRETADFGRTQSSWSKGQNMTHKTTSRKVPYYMVPLLLRICIYFQVSKKKNTSSSLLYPISFRTSISLHSSVSIFSVSDCKYGNNSVLHSFLSS